ncbi:DEKNAAC101043 [Brettanomyces naardenensis]|uniref:AP-1 complex subunit gamma n=1 Tax=Brettanomyces naardenensis TaxID=13370 RepID=A0A448YGY6_BRENA|nr:DEKNAAC101043 [Brettanomyces naardenensis]
MTSLRSFIRSVRSTKTIAEERAAIRKESAKIRTSFRDPHLDESHRRKNIQKLLYLYILGEPTYFGQVECLKLLVSPSFSNKRLGYMAAMLILDENQEILTLLTNSLDNDLKSPNQYIAGLALSTLGNIASPELAKDLYANVESLLNTSSPYLRKKATIVAAKLVKKEPDLAEVFIEKIPSLLKERSHGTLLGTLQLMREIFLQDESSHDILRKLVPGVLAHLRFLATTGFSPEYDVKGVPDPFLYVSLLQTLRYLLEGDESNPNLEALDDLLTQICARLENSKGPGHAVLYEAVMTIFAVNSDSSLRVMGVGILSKFLSLKDNNTRYVALNTLLSVISHEPVAVQRHRAMIVGCLQDADVSIRRRALELTFAIMNQQNIRMLTKELVQFLAATSSSDDELKTYITTQLTLACYKYSPGIDWTFDTLIRMLEIAGNFFSDDIISSILALMMQNRDAELTKKAVRQLLNASKVAYSQFGLAIVTIWSLGEYGDLVLDSQKVTEASEVDVLNTFLELSTFDETSKRDQIRLYSLTAALKLSSRFKSSREVERLRKLIDSSKEDTNLEVQIRAIEYTEIFGEPRSIKKGLLERMPPPPRKEHEGAALFGRSTAQKSVSEPAKTGDLLLDLFDNDDSQADESKPAEKETTLDILSDIFGTTGDNEKTAAGKKVTGNTDILNLLSGSSPSAAPSAAVIPPTTRSIPMAEPPASLPTPIPAYNDSTISVGFVPGHVGNGEATLTGVVKNETSSSTVRGISILCAVTKHQELELSAITKNTLAPGAVATLGIKITGKEGSKVKLRIKVGYEIGGENVGQQFDFSGITERL